MLKTRKKLVLELSDAKSDKLINYSLILFEWKVKKYILIAIKL